MQRAVVVVVAAAVVFLEAKIDFEAGRAETPFHCPSIYVRTCGAALSVIPSSLPKSVCFRSRYIVSISVGAFIGLRQIAHMTEMAYEIIVL